MGARKEVVVQHPMTCLKEHEWGELEANTRLTSASLSEIKVTLSDILAQVRLTNGRVNGHDGSLMDKQRQLDDAAITLAGINREVTAQKTLIQRVTLVGGTVAAVVGVANLPQLVQFVEQLVHRIASR